MQARSVDFNVAGIELYGFRPQQTSKKLPLVEFQCIIKERYP